MAQCTKVERLLLQVDEQAERTHCLIAKDNEGTANYIETAQMGAPSQALGVPEAQPQPLNDVS
jgi:hypothetical protein